MDCLGTFINNVYIHLTGIENNKTNIIRIHNRKLQECGDLSFPLNISNWSSLIGKELDSNIRTIFEFRNDGTLQENIDKMILESSNWILSIEKCQLNKDNVYIYIDRARAFRTVLKDVCSSKENYGAVPLCKNLNINVSCDVTDDEEHINLTELRVKLLERVTKTLIEFCGGVLTVNRDVSNFKINFTLQTSNNSENVVCGPVLNNKGIKDVKTTASDFYKERTLDMRLMAEHKYGIRITSQPGWSDFFKKLGDAAVIIELLRNKPSNTLTTDINNQLLSSRKGAAFILYNCARLATLFKEFDQKVSSNVYPKLPDHEQMDFKLLVEQEEWDLLYNHILQFPRVIHQCMRDIADKKVYPNCLIAALSSMCLSFSVYYRRVKILIEPRMHLFASMHVRIYLLKALEQVLHNGLRILDIQPVKQM